MLKGDKLIFIKSGNIYWDKVELLLVVDEFVKMSINIGNIVEDNGNCFVLYVFIVDLFRLLSIF